MLHIQNGQRKMQDPTIQNNCARSGSTEHTLVKCLAHLCIAKWELLPNIVTIVMTRRQQFTALVTADKLPKFSESILHASSWPQ